MAQFRESNDQIRLKYTKRTAISNQVAIYVKTPKYCETSVWGGGGLTPPSDQPVYGHTHTHTP